MKKLLYFFITIALFSGCKTVKQTSNTNIAFLTLEKTMCRGQCPVYSLSIFDNGLVKYSGKKNVEKIGNFEKTLSNAEIQSLKTAFNQADFFSFEDEYTAKVTDLPSTYISFTNDGQTKKIRDYYGAPDSLKQLEELLVAVAESKEGWLKAANQ